MQFEGYKFDPNGEYVRRWLPELARLPTEWIHHPWDAPESLLQAAGIELGSNYPLPIVGIDAAKSRLQEALSVMWQQEAASRAAIENGTEEGLGDSSESAPIALPQDVQMGEGIGPAAGPEPPRNHNNLPGPNCQYEDQMVPSITSLVRAEDDETSSDVRSSVGDSRGEVPTTNINVNTVPDPSRMDVMDLHDPRALQTATIRTNPNNPPPRHNFTMEIDGAAEDSTAESSSATSRRERDGGVVPVWSPPTSAFSDQFVGDENGVGASSSYLPRHPQSHQIVNWRRLSQTG